MVSRGPKRRKPLDPNRMVNVTTRWPVWLLLKVDEEVARRAKASGVSTLNRSDFLRSLAEKEVK